MAAATTEWAGTRIREAAEDAMETFWTRMAENFPEVETGDWPWFEDTKLTMALLEAGETWLKINDPSEEG